MDSASSRPRAPGCGDSPSLPTAEQYLPSRLAALVLDLASALDVARFAFVGWSWGATIGVHLAARGAPLDALVLVDAGHTDVVADVPLDVLEQQFAAEQERFRFGSWEEFDEAMRSRRREWRPALEERFRAGACERGGAIVARSDPRAAAWALHGAACEPPSALLREFPDLPVLLLRSDEADDAQALRRFVELLPRADVRTLRGGHDLLADSPVETIAIVSEFVGSTPRRV